MPSYSKIDEEAAEEVDEFQEGLEEKEADEWLEGDM